MSAKSVLGGGLALVVAGVMTVAGATSASAAASPIDPDPYSTVAAGMGNITFYDSTGAVVTSGDGSVVGNPLYAVADRDPAVVPATKRGALYGYLPVAGTDPGAWGGQQLGGSTAYPIPGSPAPLSTTTRPTALHNILSFKSLANNYPVTSTNPAYKDVYQIRLRFVGQDPLSYASATVTIDKLTGAWAQIFPVPVAPLTPTTTALSVSPGSPANAPANPTLTATVAPSAATGTVEFFNGTTSLGTSPVASGVATKALTGVAAGSYSYTATLTPTAGSTYAGSTSSATAYVVKPTPSVSVTADNAAPNVGAPVTFTATVGQIAGANVPGTVEFFSGTTSLGGPAATTGGVATFTTSTLTAGTKSITAKFVPTDPAAFNGATSAPVVINVLVVQLGACATPGAQCVDPQGFIVIVPVGALFIDTPFTAANPFNLGTMTLNPGATELSTGAVNFKAQDPATIKRGITITDTRTGNLPWTANLQSSDFVKGTDLIPAKNLGFTAVTPTYIPGNALQAVSVLDNPANSVAAPLPGLAAASKFASAQNGFGTVYVDGSFTLNAPTSTPAGTYVGTVTFTIG